MGSHRFLVKEVALQAGVSTATVDRVLNERPNVKYQTRQRVLRAIGELERLQDSLNVSGERFLIDVVLEAPDRFSHVVRSAVEAEISGSLPAVFRPRFHIREAWETTALVARLRRIAHGGTKGILLKARDLPDIRSAIFELRTQNVPCVTLVTDVPDSERVAYAGMDNVQAGRTAAYLMSKFLAPKVGTIAAISSHDGFKGEDERVSSFRDTLALELPQFACLNITGGYGLAESTYLQIKQLLTCETDIQGIYSSGGGNRAILAVFDEFCLEPPVIIGHDLDEDNAELLADRRIDALIVHDLRRDIRFAFSKLLQFHKPRLEIDAAQFSNVQIITPENLPSSFAMT